MDKLALNAESRQETGKIFNRRLRRSGRIPAVVYGGDNQQKLSVDTLEFSNLFKNISENFLIQLKVDGKETKEVLVKDYQSDYVKGEITHIDFFEVSRGQTLHTQVPVHVEGSAIGVRDGGVLEQLLHTLQVECLPKDIPEEIVVDVSKLGGNEALHVSDLQLPAGVASLDSLETVIATVTMPSSSVTTEEGEEDAEASVLAADTEDE